MSDQPITEQPITEPIVRGQWRVIPDANQPYVGYCELFDGKEWIYPDCCYDCSACGACLGCERKLVHADILEGREVEKCPATADGLHVVVLREDDDDED